MGGDAFKALEKQFGMVMTDFYQRSKFRRGRTPGQAFTGKTLRKMMKPNILEELKRLLGNGIEAEMWTNYLASIIQLHTFCVKKELLPGRILEDAFCTFKQCFQEIIIYLVLSET